MPPEEGTVGRQFVRKWQKEIEKINKVLSQLQKANQVPVEKKRELETEIKRIEGVING